MSEKPAFLPVIEDFPILWVLNNMTYKNLSVVWVLLLVLLTQHFIPSRVSGRGYKIGPVCVSVCLSVCQHSPG